MIAPQELRARVDAVFEAHEAGDLDGVLERTGALLDEVAGVPLDDPVVRESVFATWFERAVVLTELGRPLDARHAYVRAAEIPGDLADPDQRHEVAMARLNEGIVLADGGDHAAAVAVYERLCAQLGGANDPVTAELVLRARVNLAVALLALGRSEDAESTARAVADELDVAGDDRDDGPTAEQWAMAVRVRAAALGEVGRSEEAADVLATVEQREWQGPAERVQLLAARTDRARLLIELGRADEGRRTLEDLAEVWPDDGDPALEEVRGEVAALWARLGSSES